MREESEKFKIARCFAKAAITYDQASNFQREIGSELLIKMQQHTLNPEFILDVGAGTGFFGRVLSQQYQNANILNVDIAFSMMQYAFSQLNNTNCKNICADFDALPFQHQQIDVVFSNMVVQWSVDLSKTLRELSRVLKKGGVLAFSMPVDGTLFELSRCKDSVLGEGSSQVFYSQDSVRNLIQENEFQSCCVEVEKVVQYYSAASELFDFLKLTGANYPRKKVSSNVLRGKRYRQSLEESYEIYRDEQGRLPATFNIAYVVVKK